MAELPVSLGNYMWFSIVYGIVVLVYSLYLLYLNRKQANVVKILKETNEILLRIEDKLKK